MLKNMRDSQFILKTPIKIKEQELYCSSTFNSHSRVSIMRITHAIT
jgi:hypothetical protein